MKTAKTLTLALLTIALAAVGCSSTGSDSDTDNDNGSGGNGSDSGSGGNGTDSGSGGNGTDSDTDSGVGGGAGSDGGDGLGGATTGGSGNGSGGLSLPDDIEFEYDPTKDMEPETCADVEISSEEIFLDIFVILDRSGSMTRKPDPDGSGGSPGFGDNDSRGYCDIGETNVGSRWCNAINSLYGFFTDPTTVGTGFSYGEFSDSGCGAFDMDTEFGIIEDGDPTEIDNLVVELNDNNPAGSTNTEGALDTLIAETGSHTPSGTRRTIGILITDGDPNGCEEDIDDLNTLIANHYTATGIPTYIIGMTGADEDNLEGMAVGAGAEPHADYCDPNHATCSYYTVGDGDPAAFIAALDSIRESELGCEYAVPNAEIGVGNLDTLDVQFTPAAGEDAIGLTRVGNDTNCTDDDQYYVELGAEDSIIKLCPGTCELRGDGASVDISLKCEGS